MSILKKFVPAALFSLLVGLALVPAFVSAQTAPCTVGYPNNTTYCGTGTLDVYVQVLQSNTGAAYAPGNFTVQVSGVNPSPASFPGSQSGTVVSLGAGSYSVAIPSTNGYTFTPSYSQGCTGSVYNNSTATCVVTLSPTSNYSSYPTPYPYPYNYPQLACTPAYQTVNLGQTVSLTATGGTGNSYSWSTPSQNFASAGGPVFTTTLEQSGTQVITVSNGNQLATCTVNVVATGGAVIYPTNYNPTTYATVPTITASYYPALPNTGFAPVGQTGLSFALAAVLLIAASIATYPYVRKAIIRSI